MTGSISVNDVITWAVKGGHLKVGERLTPAVVRMFKADLELSGAPLTVSRRVPVKANGSGKPKGSGKVQDIYPGDVQAVRGWLIMKGHMTSWMGRLSVEMIKKFRDENPDVPLCESLQGQVDRDAMPASEKKKLNAAARLAAANERIDALMKMLEALNAPADDTAKEDAS